MRRVILLLFGSVVFSSSILGQTASPMPPDAEAEKRRGDALQTRFNNYANYGRYHEANAALPSPGKNERRVVFIGDSITDSWKLAEYFPGKPYINRGISGQTTSQMLLRFRPDVIALRPKVVVILAGTNDIAGNTGPITLEAIQGNLASMVELARSNGINVVLASVMPVSDYNKNAAGNQITQTIRRPPEKISALNAWIKQFAAERKLVYLDYFSAMADEHGLLKSAIANDGLHPNAKGYELIKPLAEDAIKIALRSKQRR